MSDVNETLDGRLSATFLSSVWARSNQTDFASVRRVRRGGESSGVSGVLVGSVVRLRCPTRYRCYPVSPGWACMMLTACANYIHVYSSLSYTFQSTSPGECRSQWLSERDRGLRPLLRFEPPRNSMSPLIESIKCYFMPK